MKLKLRSENERNFRDEEILDESVWLKSSASFWWMGNLLYNEKVCGEIWRKLSDEMSSFKMYHERS